MMNNTNKRHKKISKPKSNFKARENRYKFIKSVGEGTFGSVYKVYQYKRPNKFYAIKKISHR